MSVMNSMSIIQGTLSNLTRLIEYQEGFSLA